MLFLCFSVAVTRPIKFASMNYIMATSWREFSRKESNAQVGVDAIVIRARNLGHELKAK